MRMPDKTAARSTLCSALHLTDTTVPAETYNLALLCFCILDKNDCSFLSSRNTSWALRVPISTNVWQASREKPLEWRPRFTELQADVGLLAVPSLMETAPRPHFLERRFLPGRLGKCCCWGTRVQKGVLLRDCSPGGCAHEHSSPATTSTQLRTL